MAFILWAGETIDVRTGLGDLNEDLEILLDELGFVLRPNRSTNALIPTRLALSVDR